MSCILSYNKTLQEFVQCLGTFLLIEVAQDFVQALTYGAMKIFPVLLFVNNFEKFKKNNNTQAKKNEQKKLPSISIRVLPFTANARTGHFDI